MSTLLIKSGLLVNPDSMAIKDILIIEDRIVKIAGNIKAKDNWETVDCSGKIIVPGLIDMHTHLRTPGQEHKETIVTGSLAALAGGFTTVVCMANTLPVVDNPEILHLLGLRIERDKLIDILPASAVSKNLDGKTEVDFQSMAAAGARAFSDDGKGIQNPLMLDKAMKQCADLRLPLLLHCQDDRFDVYDKRSEYYYVSMVLKMAECLKLPAHIQHVSCAESVELIRIAKRRNVPVTCETAPHYISLTSRDYKKLGANAKMNPPLRSEKDRRSVINGLVDGTIDVIATDHAPHSAEEKSSAEPPFGIIGLETAIPVVFSHLRKRLNLPEIISKLTSNPAKILGLSDRGWIKEEMLADLTVINRKMRKDYRLSEVQSRSHNSPWLGKRMQIWPIMTIKKGKICYRDGRFYL